MGAEDVIAAALHAAEVEKDTTAAAQRVIDGRASIASGGFPAAVVEQSSSRQVAMLDEVGGGGVTDHGALTGLPDNDHPQYALVAAGAFTTAAPTSAVAGSLGTNQLARMLEVDAYIAYLYGVVTGDIATAIAGRQPLDSDLTAIAALTTTSYGRSFLALADAAAARTALALGALAVLATVGTSQIDDAAVTLAKQANLAAATIIGRASGAGTGVPTALSSSQVATIVQSTGTFSEPGHTHSATEVDVDDGWFSGAFSGQGFTTLRDVLIWLDANITPP